MSLMLLYQQGLRKSYPQVFLKIFLRKCRKTPKKKNVVDSIFHKVADYMPETLLTTIPTLDILSVNLSKISHQLFFRAPLQVSKAYSEN